MNQAQQQSFLAGAGYHASWLHAMSQIVMGGVAFAIAIFLIAQLILGLGRDDEAHVNFMINLLGVAAIVVLVFLILS